MEEGGEREKEKSFISFSFLFPRLLVSGPFSFSIFTCVKQESSAFYFTLSVSSVVSCSSRRELSSRSCRCRRRQVFVFSSSPPETTAVSAAARAQSSAAASSEALGGLGPEIREATISRAVSGPERGGGRAGDEAFSSTSTLLPLQLLPLAAASTFEAPSRLRSRRFLLASRAPRTAAARSPATHPSAVKKRASRSAAG